jgi:transcriptional regulator with XRE-family HTH domain
MADGAAGPDPTVHRRRLRNELRKTRESAGMTQRDVAAAMDWSQSKLIRIETGAVNISTNDLRALLTHYGTDQARIEALVELARAAREVPRWSMYRNVAEPEYIAFLGYESSAKIIRNFEPLLIPGLLQTEEYAREVISYVEAENPHNIDALVDLRVQRQEIVTKPGAPDLHFIMDEAVVRRLIGGPNVSRRQLKHLLEINQQPNVTMRVVPFTAGMYPRLRVPYVHFEFPDPEDEDVLYVEYPSGELIVRENSPEEKDRVDPVTHLAIFWQLEQIAKREDFEDLVESAIADLEKGMAPVPERGPAPTTPRAGDHNE